MLEQAANGAILNTLKVGFLTYTPRYYRTKQLIKDYIETVIFYHQKISHNIRQIYFS